MSKALQIDEFIAHWKDTGGSEHANYQLFVIELTELLGLDRPNAGTNDHWSRRRRSIPRAASPLYRGQVHRISAMQSMGDPAMVRQNEHK